MKQYNIYASPTGMKEAVKQGWSWPGFCFTVIWCFVKKLNIFGLIILGVIIITTIIDIIFVIDTSVPVGVGSSMACGQLGNKQREENLVNRGFELKSTVSAQNPEGAIALYLKEKEV